jgi:MinD-like ATPase involved in chromosome partitioning or flagellar assembly
MITVVTSWRGVGATTTAFLLAAAMAGDESSWLIEADPAGGVLSGRVHLTTATVAGLERVAFGPIGLSAGETFGAIAEPIGAVRLVVAPADPYRAHTCHMPRVPWQTTLRSLDHDVVIDAGRHRPGSPVGALLRQADVVVVVTSPDVTDVVATGEWLRARGRVAVDEPGFGDVPCVVAAVAAPAGVAFSERTLRDEFGDRFGSWLQWEPATVDLVLRGGAPDDRRLRRSSLLAGARQLSNVVRRLAEVLV